MPTIPPSPCSLKGTPRRSHLEQPLQLWSESHWSSWKKQQYYKLWLEVITRRQGPALWNKCSLLSPQAFGMRSLPSLGPSCALVAWPGTGLVLPLKFFSLLLHPTPSPKMRLLLSSTMQSESTKMGGRGMLCIHGIVLTVFLTGSVKFLIQHEDFSFLKIRSW